MQKSSRPWTVKQVTSMIDTGSLVFDNAVQRSFVWDKNRMSLFIDSLIRDYPIPAFYAITNGRKVTTPKGEVSVYDCLDGKQRCTTLHKFINNEFALQNLEPVKTMDGEVDLNGLTYETLPEELKDAFRNAHINAYSFDDATDEDVVEIMARLNNGKPLSAIDNTRIKAADLAGICRLAAHPLFTEFLSEKALASRQNEEIVVKAITHIADPTSGLENKNIRPVYASLVITPDIEERMTSRFDYLHDVLTKMKDQVEQEKLSNVKKAYKSILKKTHMVAIMLLVDRAVRDMAPVDEFAEMLTQFFEEGSPSISEDYNAACSNGSNQSANVSIRATALLDHYDWYFNTANA